VSNQLPLGGDQQLGDDVRNSRRRRPYIWVSWATPLLAGSSCQWAAWFKSHYRYAKRDRDDNFDRSTWTREHNKMVQDRRKLLEADGWAVTLEEANSFKLEGRAATLAGKPDLVAVKGARAVIFDEKSGKERRSDRWQVLIYMLSLARQKLKGLTVEGAVEYRGKTSPIPPGELDDRAQQAIWSTLTLIGADTEPPRAPSESECRFCDIADCPERFAPKKSEETIDASDSF